MEREILFEGEKEILYENGFGTNRLVESSRSTNGQLLMAIIWSCALFRSVNEIVEVTRL